MCVCVCVCVCVFVKDRRVYFFRMHLLRSDFHVQQYCRDYNLMSLAELTAKKLSERLENMANTPTLLLYNLLDWLHNVTSDEGRSLHGLIDELYDRRRGELRVVLLCEAYCVGDVLSAVRSLCV